MKTLVIDYRSFFSLGTTVSNVIRLKFILSILFISLLANSKTYSQTELIPVSDLTHSLVYPSGTFNSGDEVTIEIHFGESSTPIELVVYMDLQLEYTDNAIPPIADQIDLSNSWLANGTTLTNSSSVDAASQTMNINASRSDSSGTDGSGEIVRITLVCGVDNLAAEDLVASLDGGLGVIDNVDMKTLPLAAPANNFRCYPNPVMTDLNLKGLQPGEAFGIYDAAGNLVRNGKADGTGYQKVNMSQLPSGFYILRTESGNQKKIMVR